MKVPNPLDAAVRVSMLDTEAHRNGRARSVLGRMVAQWIVLVGLTLLFLERLPVHDGFTAVVGFILGVSASRAAVSTYRRATAYRSGWIAGRTALITSMVEAQAHGVTAADWARAETDRDGQMF